MSEINARDVTDRVLRKKLRNIGATSVLKLFVSNTAVGNVGTGEDDLITYTMPAYTLWKNGNGIRVTAWGDAPDNAGTKTLKTYFGTQIVATDDIKANQIDKWKVIYTVWRTGVGSQSWESDFMLSGTATAILLEAGTSTQDETTALTIKCTGEGTSDNDIVQRGMMVEFLP